MSIEHVMTVRGRSAKVEPAAVVQNCVNADTLRLELDAEWDGLAASVVFARECGAPVEVAYLDRPVRVPWELLREPGPLWAVAVGRRRDAATGEVSERVCTARLGRPMRVVPSGEVSGVEPSPGPSDPGGRSAVAVPSIGEGGELTWSWGEVGDPLPGPVVIRGPSGLMVGEGEPGEGMREGRVYLDTRGVRLYVEE